MTKAEIINQIAEQTGVAKKDVSTTVEAFMETIRISLAENKEAVFLRGFGCQEDRPQHFQEHDHDARCS